jgi:hypothetical protein
MLPICKGPAQGQNIQRLCGEDVTGTQRAQQHVLRVMNSLFSFVPLKNTNVVETIINYPFGFIPPIIVLATLLLMNLVCVLT